MYDVRESWTDEPLDDFAKHVDQRFDKVEREMDQRFDKVEHEMDRRFEKVDHELHRINDRLDGISKVMVQAAVAMPSSMVAGFLVLAGLILAR